MNGRYQNGFAVMSLTLIFVTLISMAVVSSTYLSYLRIHRQHITQLFMQSTIKTEVNLDRFLIALYEEPSLLSNASECPISFSEEGLALSLDITETYKLQDSFYLCSSDTIYELGVKVTFSESSGESTALRKVAYSEGMFEWLNDTRVDF